MDVLLWWREGRDLPPLVTTDPTSEDSTTAGVLPDATILLDYLLAQTVRILDGLRVYPERMRENLDRSYGLVYSQRVLLALTSAGMPRTDAYAIVQRHAMAAWNEAPDLKARLLADPAVERTLARADLEACFDPSYFTRNVNRIFDRVLGASVAAGR